ncbi:hypothetical protein TH66_11360 [Carbonactinospora thermoautotrophica]|uniref:HTH marR-type domain-containing protein n=1 Tax=Carbonactinospora thermoautotrophica TaxID=1469144 RepID=A0A132N189_9ACTN|nr:hypothetical protein TH66_11360 [Carbonactinospora thermoautotrophica]KWX10544.1 hypothetical protein TR74_02985 [Carbonactinospora thermoautotrophica]
MEQVDEQKRLIERIETAEQRMLRLAVRTRCAPLLTLDLTIQQLKTLHVLAQEGALSGHELAKVLGVGAATASGIIDRLVVRGLVQRTKDPHDRRVRRVALTADGQRIVEELASASREYRRRLLARLDLDTLSQLADALEKLHAAAEDEAREQDVAAGP